MSLLLFISTKIIYKRFLVLWATAGLFLTSSVILKDYFNICLEAVEAFGIIALVSWIFSLLVNKSKFGFRITIYEILMVLYLVIAAFSGTIKHCPMLVYLIFRIAVPIMFGLSYIYAFSKNDLKIIIYGITLYGLINVVFSYYLYLAGVFGIETPYPISAFFCDRNGYSRYLSIVSAYFLIDFLQLKNSARRFFYGVLLAGIFLGILIQYSRSGYIVYFLSLTIVLFTCGSKSIKKAAFIILPIVLALFIHFTIVRFNSEHMAVANYSDLGRLYMLKAGINMIKAHPIQGVGYGMSQLVFQQYADKFLPGLKSVTAIHNWFVAVWAEMGILGLIAFCALNYSLMRKTLKNFLQSGLKEGKYALFAFISLLILMIDGLFLPNYDYENIYWIIIAIAVVSLKNVKIPPQTIIDQNIGTSYIDMRKQ